MRKRNEIDPRARALRSVSEQAGLSEVDVEARFQAGFAFFHDGHSVRWVKSNPQAADRDDGEPGSGTAQPDSRA